MALVLRQSTHIANGQKSCGGAPDTSQTGIIPHVGTVNSLFDKVLKDQSISGITEYRLVYIYNDAGSTDVIHQPAVKLLGQPESEIAIGALAKNTQGESIASESTAPSGVTFNTQADLNSGTGYLTFPGTQTLNPGEYCGIWIRRKTSAASGSGTIIEELALEVSFRE